MNTNGKAPTRRVNHGKGHSYYLDGEKVPSITGILSAGFPKAALIDWAAGATADYAVDNWDALAELTASKRHNELKRARFATSSEAKIRGTTIHDFAHRLALGQEVDVPDEYADHVDAYLAFANEWTPAELMIETPVYSRRYQYAGTPDMIAILNDGRTWLIDWKTGVKGNVYLDHVLQLAAARFADFALDDAGNEVPIPPIDMTGIVTLTADGYQLVPVEANDDAHFVFRCVKWVADFNADRDAWISDPIASKATA